MPKHTADPDCSRSRAQPKRGRRTLGVVKGGGFAPARSSGKAKSGNKATRGVEDAESREQVDTIVAAVAAAEALIVGALNALRDPDATATSVALGYNFHTTDPDDIEDIVEAYEEILEGLRGPHTIYVSDETDSMGHVTDYGLWMGDIYLEQPWFGQDPLHQAGTLVHEGSHKWAGTGHGDGDASLDARYAERTTVAYESSSAADALNNAYAFQWFALDTHRPRLATVEQSPFLLAERPPELGGPPQPLGYTWSEGAETRNVVYRGQDGKLYELSDAGEGWRLTCLTDLTGASPARGAPSVYTSTSDDTRRLLFVDADRRLQQLWSSAGRAWELSRGLPASRPKADGRPHGWAGSGRHHIAYPTEDRHIQVYTWDSGQTWRRADVSAACEAPLVKGDVVVCGEATDALYSVVYAGYDHHIHRIRCGLDGVVTYHDVTGATRAPEAVGDCSALQRDFDGTLHVCFRDEAGGIHHVTKKPGESSRRTELLKITGGRAAGGDPAFFTRTIGRELHVVYVDDDGGLHDLVRDREERWSHSALPGTAKASGLCGFDWAHAQTLHVFYADESARLCEVVRREGVWSTASVSIPAT